MQRSHLCLVFTAACAGYGPGASSPATSQPHTGASESEWAAASDLAATLARAAGGQRVAPALRIKEHGSQVQRKLTLAAGGCYHIGVAWVFAADLQAGVTLDPGRPTERALGERRIGAPGGSVDFCTDHGGVASLTFRPNAPVGDSLELAVVYGSAPDPAKPHVAPKPTVAAQPRQARQHATVAR